MSAREGQASHHVFCRALTPFISLLCFCFCVGFASGNVTAISPVLERVLEEIRATGVPCYSWAHLKKLLSAKLQVAMDQVAAADTNSSTVGVGWSPTNKNKSSERRATITELLNTFEGRVAVVLLSLLPGVEEGSCKLTRNVLDVLCSPPFTLQRLTEVILEPQKSYKTLNKLLNALEKVWLHRC